MYTLDIWHFLFSKVGKLFFYLDFQELTQNCIVLTNVFQGVIIVFQYFQKLLVFCFYVGSAAYKKLKEILTRPRLITAIRKLSDYRQTSSLEAKHALDNQFASKKIYYPYHSLMARFNLLIILQCSVILYIDLHQFELLCK